MRYIVIFTTFMAFGNVYGQIVNIETLRFMSDSNGFFGQLTSEVEYKKDKVQKLNLGGGVHAALRLNRHNVLTNTTLEYEKVDDMENENNFFLHARYNYSITRKWITELFFQMRYDDFLNIDQRELVGAGMRFEIINQNTVKIFAGMTAMYEYEVLTNEDVNKKIRMSDYLSFRYNSDEFSFTSTVYYQPELADFSNYRTTWSSQAAFKLFKKLGLFINYDLNYDSRRPEGIPDVVAGLTGGLSLAFH